MALPEPMSIKPREAAVTAALAGAVVVVLGYASGLGLRTPLIAAEVKPPVAATAVVEQPLPAPVPAAAVVIPPTVVVVTATPAPVPSIQQFPTPTPTAAPTTPVDPPVPTCDPGLVGGLLAPVDSLLSGLLGGTGRGGGLLSCTLDGLVGTSSCCDAVAVRNAGASR